MFIRMLSMWLMGACLVALAPGATAEEGKSEALVLYTQQIPHVIHTENPGPYDQLLSILLSAYGKPVDRKPASVRRSWQTFANVGKGCFFIGNNNEEGYRHQGIDPANLIFSTPVNNLRLRIYSRYEDGTASSPQLKTVAMDASAMQVATNAAGFTLKSDQTIVVETLEKALSLLLEGRVETLLAFDSDLNNVLRGTGMASKLQVGPEVLSLDETFVCHPDAQTKAFLQLIDQELRSMSCSGRLAEILGLD